jgi:hypothetical protein
VDGLAHITLVASTADLFYSTVQFYESLGFKAVCLVSNPLSLSIPRSPAPPLFSLFSFLPSFQGWLTADSSTGRSPRRLTLILTCALTLRRRRGCTAGPRTGTMSPSKSD